MAESKSKKADDPEAGLKEVQERVDKELEQGFVGTKVDPIDNKEYSIQSGPDSPTIAEQYEALAEAELEKDKDRHAATKNAI